MMMDGGSAHSRVTAASASATLSSSMSFRSLASRRLLLARSPPRRANLLLVDGAPGGFDAAVNSSGGDDDDDSKSLQPPPARPLPRRRPFASAGSGGHRPFKNIMELVGEDTGGVGIGGIGNGGIGSAAKFPAAPSSSSSPSYASSAAAAPLPTAAELPLCRCHPPLPPSRRPVVAQMPAAADKSTKNRKKSYRSPESLLLLLPHEPGFPLRLADPISLASFDN